MKVVEFVEGEPCKFILSSGDHRIHFKASSLDVKQHWITALRTAILAKSSKHGKKKNKPSNMSVATLSVEQPHPSGQMGDGVENGWGQRDICNPSPSPSYNDLNAAAAANSQFEQVSICLMSDEEYGRRQRHSGGFEICHIKWCGCHGEWE